MSRPASRLIQGMNKLELLNREIVTCRLCPRLVEYRAQVAGTKRRAFLDWEYWGKPVPGFGDPAAQLLLIGLAPGAHGANRTGRMFTGDRSGDFLYRALYEAGFASQPQSVSAGDGMKLSNAYISAAVRCAPPENKPEVQEFKNCRPYLETEISLLPEVRVVVVLGKAAFDTYLAVLQSEGKIERRSAFAFGHNREHRTGPHQPVLICSYHPSQQNTSTGKLTVPMFRAVFELAKKHLNAVR